jgi:CMP-N,N'-diacetyllegionaminic acid synthase
MVGGSNGAHRVLAVITARGGSKAVPRKNVLPLGGKPLIAWTIEAAYQSKRLDRVILSTDDDEIAEIGRSFGCEVPFKRPAELATDTSHHPDVMIHAARFMADTLKDSYDTIMCLQPTVPFRKPSHIDEAIGAFFEAKADSLISLKPQDYPPWWMFSLDDARIRPAFDYKPGVNVFNLERQEFPKVYRPNGAIYITWTESLYQHHRLVNPSDCAYYLMQEVDSVDIDTFGDFAAAEAMLKLKA